MAYKVPVLEKVWGPMPDNPHHYSYVKNPQYTELEAKIQKYLEDVPDSEYISSYVENVVSHAGVDMDQALKILAEIEAARPKGKTNKYMVGAN